MLYSLCYFQSSSRACCFWCELTQDKKDAKKSLWTIILISISITFHPDKIIQAFFIIDLSAIYNILLIIDITPKFIVFSLTSLKHLILYLHSFCKKCMITNHINITVNNKSLFVCFYLVLKKNIEINFNNTFY